MGTGLNPSPLTLAGCSPDLSPEDPVGWGKQPFLWHCLGPSQLSLSLRAFLSPTGRLASVRPAGVTPGKDRTHPLPFQAFSLSLLSSLLTGPGTFGR